jgi:hypothetical protein
MIICATALLAWVLGKQGMQWEGAGAAWIVAAILDTSLIAWIAFLIWA